MCTSLGTVSLFLSQNLCLLAGVVWDVLGKQIELFEVQWSVDYLNVNHPNRRW
jgi:hypothetical protein